MQREEARKSLPSLKIRQGNSIQNNIIFVELSFYWFVLRMKKQIQSVDDIHKYLPANIWFALVGIFADKTSQLPTMLF